MQIDIDNDSLSEYFKRFKTKTTFWKEQKEFTNFFFKSVIFLKNNFFPETYDF